MASGAASKTCWYQSSELIKDESSAVMRNSHAEDSARGCILDPDFASVCLDGQLAKSEAQAAPAPRRLPVLPLHLNEGVEDSLPELRRHPRSTVDDADLRAAFEGGKGDGYGRIHR